MDDQTQTNHQEHKQLSDRQFKQTTRSKNSKQKEKLDQQDNEPSNITKKVTFNQNRLSSHENVSSDRYSSMNSKTFSQNNPISKNDHKQIPEDNDRNTDCINELGKDISKDKVNQKDANTDKQNGNSKNGSSRVLDSRSLQKLANSHQQADSKCSPEANRNGKNVSIYSTEFRIIENWHDHSLDQMADYAEFESMYEYDNENEQLLGRKRTRGRQMQKRLQKLQSAFQTNIKAPQPDEQLLSNSNANQDAQPPYNLNPPQEQPSTRQPAIAQPQIAAVVKQQSINSRKKVCISEEPNKENQKQGELQNNATSQAQSDGTFLSVSSFDEKFGYGKGTDKQEQGSNKSIISEQESQYEECTPAGNKENLLDINFSASVGQSKLKQTDPNAMIDQKSRELQGNKKSMSITGKNNQFDNPKAKPVRTQTMGKQTDTKNKLQHESPGTKSKGGLTNIDQDSIRSLKFISNKQRGNHLQTNEKKRDSAVDSVFNQTEQINIVNLNYKKQGTQDFKQTKKTTQEEGRDSRNNSLNLTVDNQLDQLSINFGAQKFGYQHFNKIDDRDSQQRKHGSVGKDKQRTKNSLLSSSNLKQQTPQDYILAKSKQRMDPHSNDRFKRQISNDSRFKSPRQQFSPSLKVDQNVVYDVSTKSVISALDKPNVVASTSNFEERDQRYKQKGDLIGIYMKKPYKVMSIKQIKAREQKGNVRLFQAENNLKVHTGYNKHRYNYNTSRIPSQNEQRIRGSFQKNLSPSQVLLVQNRSRGRTRDSKGVDSSNYNQSRGSFSRPNQNYIHYQNSQGPIHENHNTSSSNNQYGKISPLGKEHLNDDNESKSQLNVNHQQQVSPGLPKRTKAEKDQLEREFKIRFYDHLLYQMDKQQEAMSSELKSLQTKENLCNVYGQTLSLIEYGNASYSPHLRNNRRLTKSPRQEHKQRNKNDILKPLGQELREKNSNTIKSNMKLSLSNVNEYMMDHHIIAESARVNKEIVSVTNVQHLSPRTSLPNQPSTEKQLVDENTQRDYNESITMFQSSRKNEDDNEFQEIIEEYDLNLSQNNEQLRQLIEVSNTMGYSHQQIKHLKEKHLLIKQLEQQLKGLINKLNRQSAGNSGKKDQHGAGFKKQLTGHSYDVGNKSRKEQRQIQKLSFDREIKSYYPEPQEKSRFKESNSALKQQKPSTGTTTKVTQIQQNKQTYANKVNSLMYGSHNIPPGRSNDNSALGAISKRTNQTAFKAPNEADDINIQDYIGNKINLRRSIEQMNYDTKQFKRNPIDLKYEFINDEISSKQQFNTDNYKNQRSNTMSKVINGANSRHKQNVQYQHQSWNEKPKFDFIKNNRKHILPFAENQINVDQDFKQYNQGNFTPNQTTQLPNIIASSRQSVNLMQNDKSISRQNRGNKYHKTQNIEQELRTSNQVASIKNGNIDTSVIQKLKNAENQIRDSKFNSQRQNLPNSNQQSKQRLDSSPQQEKSPSINKQRPKQLNETKGSKQRLIQSGQHIMTNPNIYSSVNNEQSSNSNAQLSFQYKNISPRFPGFKNNLQQLQKKSQDLQNQIMSMELDKLNPNLKQTAIKAGNQVVSGYNRNSFAQSDYYNGRQHASKQNQILRGVLNHQRKVTRNDNVYPSQFGPSSTGITHQNNQKSLSQNSSSLNMQTPIHHNHQFNSNDQRQIQSVGYEQNSMINDQSDYIQQIQSGAHNVRGYDHPQQQQIQSMNSSLNAPGQ